MSIGASGDSNVARNGSVDIVENFWQEVWRSRRPDAIDRLVTEDIVITTAGSDVHQRAPFKRWVVQFQQRITDLQFETIETFQSEDGSRVASRWRMTGKNNGILGLAPNHEPIELTGITVFAICEDGLIQQIWVERSAWELYERLQRA
jgi:steroid delta-isomerase-like uncharacterized protein